MNAYNKIFNPYTNSFVNTNSNVGRYLINNMMGGATDDPECCRKLAVGFGNDLINLSDSINEKHKMLNDNVINLYKKVTVVEEVLKRINRQLQ